VLVPELFVGAESIEEFGKAACRREKTGLYRKKQVPGIVLGATRGQDGIGIIADQRINLFGQGTHSKFCRAARKHPRAVFSDKPAKRSREFAARSLVRNLTGVESEHAASRGECILVRANKLRKCIAQRHSLVVGDSRRRLKQGPHLGKRVQEGRQSHQ
jgi:hypothetical protein